MGMTILLIIIGVLLFNLIVFAHELGHFSAARASGMKVIEFAIGMGPRVLKFGKKGTIYSLRVFPVGGFCAVEGEDEESDSPDAYEKKTVWQRMIFVVAGATMNMILGFLMIFFLLAQKTEFNTTTIATFNNTTISSSSGLVAGDTITAVNGSKTHTYTDLKNAIILGLIADGKEMLDTDILRNGEKIHLKDAPLAVITQEDGKSSIDIGFDVKTTNKTFATLLRQAFFETVSTVKYVWSSLTKLIIGQVSVKNVMGPIGMASAVGNVATEGLKVSPMAAINNIVNFMAMITVNLGIINLLPLPALDGGRLLFLLVELITRKKLKSEHEGWIHAIGFFLLIGLMILISFGDIARLFGWS